MVAAVLGACESPASAPPAPTPTATPAPHASPTARQTPGPYAFRLLYEEFPPGTAPAQVLVASLNGGVARRIADVADQHDARFAPSPKGDALAILDKLDDHQAHTATWRLRLLDLQAGAEHDVIGPRTDAEADVPRDVAWTPDGGLVIASWHVLDRVDVASGARSTLLRFPDGTIGVLFPDFQNQTLLESQTGTTYSLYDVRSSVRKIADRPVVGLANYALRPGTGDVVELVTRFDGRVTLALVHDAGVAQWELKGPALDGYVHLVGTAANALFLAWPIRQDDPLAYGVDGGVLFYSSGYDGTLTLQAGARDWGEFAPTGVSPDGRALLVPTGERLATSASNVHFALAVCCERRPPAPLLDYGDRSVIGWLDER